MAGATALAGLAVTAVVGLARRAGQIIERHGGLHIRDGLRKAGDVVFDVGDYGVHRRFDPLDHRLGVDAHEHDGSQERHHQQTLAPAQVRHLGVGPGSRPVEHPLVGPQQIDRGQDDARGRDHRPPAMGAESAEQHQQFAHEAVEARKPHRRQHHHREHRGQHRRRLLQPAQLGDLAGVAALVDHPHQQEQRPGGHAVVHHLQHAAGEALGVERERADHDEAEVGHRRVGHQAL